MTLCLPVKETAEKYTLSAYFKLVTMPNNYVVNSTRSKPSRRNKGGGSVKREVSRFAGDAYSLAERAYKGVSHVLKLINIEQKFIDVVTTVTYSGPNPNSTFISVIPQGTDQGNRIGDSIKLQNLDISYQVVIPTTVLVQTIRITLFKDWEPTGSVPAYTDVFQSGSPVSQRNFLNLRRFTILHDDTVAIQPLSFQGAMVRKTIAQEAHIKWRTSGSAVTTCGEGHIFALFFSDGATNFPGTTFWVRIHYTDD